MGEALGESPISIPVARDITEPFDEWEREGEDLLERGSMEVKDKGFRRLSSWKKEASEEKNWEESTSSGSGLVFGMEQTKPVLLTLRLSKRRARGNSFFDRSTIASWTISPSLFSRERENK